MNYMLYSIQQSNKNEKNNNYLLKGNKIGLKKGWKNKEPHLWWISKIKINARKIPTWKTLSKIRTKIGLDNLRVVSQNVYSIFKSMFIIFLYL